MPNTIPSVYMSMPVPTPTVDPGPQYATDLNSCLGIVDSHTHAPGQGQQITPAGINITTDLSFAGNNGINFRSIRFTSQAGALATGSDIGCVYVASADLYYNDTNGNQVRLTQGGAVAGTPGSIANLLPPASVTYVPGTQTFVFQSSTATAGNLDAGSITIRPIVANASGVKISASPVTSNYTLSLPATLPTSASYVDVDPSGNITYSTVGVSRPLPGTSAVGLGGIALSITTGNAFSTASQVPTFVDVTSVAGAILQTKIVASGTRPIYVGFTVDGSTGASAGSAIAPTGTNTCTANLRWFRNSSAITNIQVGFNATGGLTGLYGPNMVNFLDVVPSSGTYTYKCQASVDNGAAALLTLQNVKIITYEM